MYKKEISLLAEKSGYLLCNLLLNHAVPLNIWGKILKACFGKKGLKEYNLLYQFSIGQDRDFFFFLR